MSALIRIIPGLLACMGSGAGFVPCSAQDTVLARELTLPFCETWEYGSFSGNGWTLIPATGNNWSIDTAIGNPAPAANFSGALELSNYSQSFESQVLDATPYDCGELWLDFDWKLVDLNSTGEESLIVEIFRDSSWREIITFINEGSVDWISEHFSINDGCGQFIKIRFTATGINSSDIQHWSLDNICVNGICSPPQNFFIDDVLVNGFHNVILMWSPPQCPGPSSQWIEWDDGLNYTSIGTGDQAEFDIAARWDVEMINLFEGGSVARIAFFPASAGTATYRLRVWKGADAETLLLDQNAPTVCLDSWNIVNILNPVPIDVTQDLWIGVHVNATGGWPAGVDDGPAIEGYGDKIYYNGAWWNLFELNPSLDYNWNLAANLINVKGTVSRPVLESAHESIPYNGDHFSASGIENQNGVPFTQTTIEDERGVFAYNVFRNYDGGPTWIQVNTDLIHDTVYNDYVNTYEEGMYYYYATSVVETCESVPSNMDSAYLLLSISEQTCRELSVYPSPTDDILKLTSSSPFTSLEVRNFIGQTVLSRTCPGVTSMEINVASLSAGIYSVSVVCKEGVRIRKIVVSH